MRTTRDIGHRHYGSIKMLNKALSYNKKGVSASTMRLKAEQLKRKTMATFYSAMQRYAPRSNRQGGGSLRACGQFKVECKVSGRRVYVTLMDNPAALKHPGDSTWRYVDKGTREYTISRNALFFYCRPGQRQMAFYQKEGIVSHGKYNATKRTWFVLHPPGGAPWKLRSMSRAVRDIIGTSIGRERNGNAAYIRVRKAFNGRVPIGASSGTPFIGRVFKATTDALRYTTKTGSIGVSMDMANDYWNNTGRAFHTRASARTHGTYTRPTPKGSIKGTTVQINAKSGRGSFKLRDMMKSKPDSTYGRFGHKDDTTT